MKKSNLKLIKYFHHGISYYNNIENKGKLIVIEGPDSSGRSTQIELLTTHLEANGHAILNTGLKRSELIGTGILEAKKTHVLGKKTMSLFYAADFADQLENKIIPALKAGYIVLSDRYIFTLMARDAVRKISRQWSQNLYGFAIIPDLVFYLDVEPRELIKRVFYEKQSLDFYESGEDMGFSNDIFESFILYQNKIKNEFLKMQKKYGIVPINGNRTIEEINLELRKQIDRFLSNQ